MKTIFRRAVLIDISEIWTILQQAIIRRKKDGSAQWQDGYPNLEVLKNDIDSNAGYVLINGDSIIGYTAIFINDEPEYENIEGKWLTNEDFIVFHRVAISEQHVGKGFANQLLENIETFAVQNKIYSIKADTNFDNLAMLNLFQKFNYTYCGEVYFRGSARRAYEKVLS